MNRPIIILSLSFLMSCATAREPASPIIITYQSNAIGGEHTGPIPPQFARERLPAKADHSVAEAIDHKIEMPEILVSLKTIDTQKEAVQKISLNLQSATIEEVVFAMQEVSLHNFVIHPGASNIILADLTLQDVDWPEALLVITELNGLVATVDGNEALGADNWDMARLKGDVIMISTFDNFIAGHEDRIKAATLSKKIAEKRRSAAQAKNITASIRDRAELTTRSYRLRYADATEVREYLQNLYGTGRQKQIGGYREDDPTGTQHTGKKSRDDIYRPNLGQRDAKISISIFKPENMITITAPKRTFGEIWERIEEIDVAPKQVYIVSRIVEIQRNYIKELGVQWGGYRTMVTNQVFPQTVGVYGGGQSADGQGSAVSLPPAGAVDPVTGETVSNPSGAVFGFSLGSVSGTTLLQAKLFALEQAGVSRTLSNPKVTAINGSRAVIKSGREIPYQSTSGNWGTTVRFKEAVISLSVTPLVIEGERIRLTIEAKKDEVDTALSIQGAPAIKKKELTTTVIVDNGGSAALGGIFVGEEGDFEGRVPWFHKIPLIGSLFKNSRKINNELELLIFITPTIIESNG